MDIATLIKKHDTKNKVIIKRKIGILDFEVNSEHILKHSVNICIDSEKLCIGDRKIRIEDLKTMYIFNVRARKRLRLFSPWRNVCSLEIVGKNILHNISINITDFSSEDLDKIHELFEYFIFSNETDYDKLTSNKYEPILKNDSIKCNYKFNNYNDVEIFDIEEWDIKNLTLKNLGIKNKAIKMDNNTYLFSVILPKKYYRKYKKKNYVLFESMYLNSNYMDVWIDSKKIIKNIDKKIARNLLKTFIKVVIMILLGEYIVSGTIESIDKIKKHYEKRSIYTEQKVKREETINKILPQFKIYYKDGFIYRDISYEEPYGTDIYCYLEFDNMRQPRYFDEDNKIDISSLKTLERYKNYDIPCKAYVVMSGRLVYEDYIENLNERIVSNIIEFEL